MIDIYAVGGYTEVGKNCTAIKVDDEVIIIDLGLALENYIKLTEDLDLIKDVLINKTRPFKILQRWSKQYGGEFITKKFSDNAVINDFNNESVIKVDFKV